MNTTGNFRVEPVQAEVIQVDQEFFPNPWTQKQWEELESSRHTLFCWRDNGDLNAFALFGTILGDDTAHLLKLFVRQSFRGSGLSINFWSKIREELLNRSFLTVYLEVEAKNIRAVAFYEKVGFKLLRRNKAYYTNGEDALMMSLTL